MCRWTQHSQELETSPSPQTLSWSPHGVSLSHPSNSGFESEFCSLADTIDFSPFHNITTLSDTPSHVDGHTTLWRSGSRERHEGSYDEETGRIKLR